MPTAHLNGIDIHFEVAGAGPRLLYLNGTGADLERVRPLLTLLQNRFELAAHDQRGLGRTEIPTTPWTMADYAADAAALMDHLGWSSCRVLGYSFGGMVAQELAVTWPERIERLALLATSPGGAGGSSFPLHELDDLGPEARTEKFVGLLDSRFDETWWAEHPTDRLLVEQIQRAAAVPRTPLQRLGERLQLEARSRHDVWDRLPRITCPTLVAVGRYDRIASVDTAQAIVSRIAGAELRVHEGGHVFTAQDPTALPGICDFLAA